MVLALTGALSAAPTGLSGPELEVLAIKEWVLIKWRVVQEQQQQLQREWRDVCERHNVLRGLPESCECAFGPGHKV